MMIASVREGPVSPGRSSVPSSSTVTELPAGGATGVAVAGGMVGIGVALGCDNVAVGGGWVGASTIVGASASVAVGRAASAPAGWLVSAPAVGTIIAWTFRWMLKIESTAPPTMITTASTSAASNPKPPYQSPWLSDARQERLATTASAAGSSGAGSAGWGAA
jgi:hypothetical protein